jgi:hypothetical protein
MTVNEAQQLHDLEASLTASLREGEASTPPPVVALPPEPVKPLSGTATTEAEPTRQADNDKFFEGEYYPVARSREHEERRDT